MSTDHTDLAEPHGAHHGYISYKSHYLARPKRIEGDSLRGSQLTTLHLDPVAWTIRADATLNVNGEPQMATLTLEDVSDVQIHRSVPLDWDYAELTEIYVTATETGLDVELFLWVDETTVLVRCTRLKVTTTT